ncbi:hypothetical protein A6V39_00725 [Candidatus Mycoplasma haematobovis]|uniref:Uncharacterized protein n=1 Tax=Candidatus Mycoplasma haematobovis TaxID=432608 RepID=A0A1A9QF35_9MOLU|nr:hypothetical protein [Candidatus Mycoplasma haematobovis]OAL10575.1 hypothetical protein A6V39_00725 [Candidatus Mycoplasma haematobovis]
MTQVGKAVALVSALGAVSGGVAVASGAFNQSEKQQPQQITKDVITISSKLASEGFEVLSTDKNSEEWRKVLEDYKNATDKSFTKTKEANKTQEQLRKNCKDILDKEDLTGDNYQLAKKWCVKKEPISKILEKQGYTLLKLTDDENTEEKPHWTAKVKDLKQNKEKFEAIKSTIKDEETATEENIKALKKGCTDLQINQTETTSDTFDKNLDLARDWCSIKTNKG